MINAIRNIRYVGGRTNTHIALRRLRLSAFTKRNGDRIGVPNIAIVITDGKSSNARATKLAAASLQNSGVIMFSIGIGKNLRQSELIAMASKPISEHIFNVDSFAALKSISNEITTKTCEDSCISKGCRNGGICTHIAKRWKCICNAGFVGKYCQHEKACYCSGYGDPHYKTFDGQVIHFMGICKYTLAASTKGAPHFFAVEVKNEHRGNTRVSYTRMVDVKLKGVTIRLLPGNKMLVNGERRSFPIRGVWGFWARYSCGWITVSTSWGLKVQFDGRHRVKVTVRGRFANKLTGICGDCNGKKDDFRTKQGNDVSGYHNKYSLIGTSYKVKDDSDRPTTKCDVSDVKTDCKPHETRRCNVIKHRIFKKCIAKLGMETVGVYLESCRIDACSYRKNIKLFQIVLCSAIEGYAGECAKAGVLVAWRKIAKCPMICPPKQVYQFATPICQPSCANLKPKCRELIEGCVCRKGYLLSGKKCVPKSECGCFYKGFYMEANEDIIDPKCQRKTICKAGGKLVTEILVPCQPNGICGLQNGKRVCICKRGFYFNNGKCIPKECRRTMADVVFLLDDSQHMLESSSKKVKQFVKDIVTNLNIGENHVRVGSVSFNSWIENHFHLNRHYNLANILNAIDAIKRSKRTSFIDCALDYLRTQSFTVANGDRVGIANVVIIVTDGRPDADSQTLKAAKAIKDSGVIVFVIAIGNGVQRSDLTVLGSEPSSEFVYTMGNFDALNRIKIKITRRICSVHRCDGRPCKNGGKCERKGKSYTCKCRRPFTGKDCSEIKPCSASPCKNGASCIPYGQDSFTCVCASGFNGRLCDEVDICAKYPCKNGGTCISGKLGLFTCKCPDGFIGIRCDEIDPCLSCPCKNAATCYPHGLGSFTCHCPSGFTGKLCNEIAPDCKCSAWGYPHYKTFDGQLIHFMGGCKYTFVTLKNMCKLPYFAVEVNNEHRGNTPVSYTRSVDLKINGATVRLWPGSKLSVNGEMMTLPLKDYMGFSAIYSVGWITVTTSFGVKVVFDGHHRIYVKVPGRYREQLTGLCGDCNGLKDDFRTKAGIDVSKKLNKYSLIGQSYEVFDDTEKSHECCKVVEFIAKCDPRDTKVCNQLKNPSGPFNNCLRRLGSSAEHYYRSCIIDVCANKNLPKIQKLVMSQSYDALASKCEEFGILVKWRSIMNCPMKCPKDQVYADRTSLCQPTCLNPTPVCPYGNTEGCVCKPGTLLSGIKCVPITSCGCIYNGMYLMEGRDLLLNDCSETITCAALNKIEKKPGCSENSMCSIDGGERQCVCKNGYKMLQGKCRIVLPSPSPEDLNLINLDPTVLHKFVHVFVASLHEKPFQKIRAKFPEPCAHSCLKDKRCKSFNFNKQKESCELFSVNAEDITLESSDSRYDDYYQLIGFKDIFIRGAEIFSCNNLKSYEGVKTLAHCKNKCRQHGCKAMEYSKKQSVCRITKSSRKEFELMGDGQWSYYEII